jgi:hypothetical protein
MQRIARIRHKCSKLLKYNKDIKSNTFNKKYVTITSNSKRGIKNLKYANKQNKKQTPWLESASELYRPPKRPPLVGEVSANFSV